MIPTSSRSRPGAVPEPSRPYAEEVTRHPGTLRIGVLTQAWGGRRTTTPVAEALSCTVRLLESLGHQVEEAKVGLGVDRQEFVLANARLMTANLTASVRRPCRSFPCPWAPMARAGGEALDGHGWVERLNDRSPFTMAFNVAGTPAMQAHGRSEPPRSVQGTTRAGVTRVNSAPQRSAQGRERSSTIRNPN
ncbi:hypothetical protein GCM10010449_15090 [Streptomyces rectiviolaceus]|uniref:Amidase domain-containing protein n=1 Tax=Streptomyces rectiviolaceus TaxID=332591 RepID=A0ABP6M9P4_9ACTN